jgi:hypothetical protein
MNKKKWFILGEVVAVVVLAALVFGPAMMSAWQGNPTYVTIATATNCDSLNHQAPAYYGTAIDSSSGASHVYGYTLVQLKALTGWAGADSATKAHTATQLTGTNARQIKDTTGGLIVGGVIHVPADTAFEILTFARRMSACTTAVMTGDTTKTALIISPIATRAAPTGFPSLKGLTGTNLIIVQRPTVDTLCYDRVAIMKLRSR